MRGHLEPDESVCEAIHIGLSKRIHFNATAWSGLGETARFVQPWVGADRHRAASAGTPVPRREPSQTQLQVKSKKSFVALESRA